MTATLLSLLNIAMGILGAVLMGYRFKKHSLGLTGNAIAGVFGSILITKTLGRLGFDVGHVISGGTINTVLLIILLTTSFLAGIGSIVLIKKATSRLRD